MPADKRPQAKRRREWRDPRPAKSAKYPRPAKGHTAKYTTRK
jgi:hypothetical protein